MTGAIAEQFEANGITARNVALQIAIAKFQNNGGTYGVALAMLNAAYGKGGEAEPVLPKGQPLSAGASPQNDGAGHSGRAAEANGAPPSPSAVRSAGQGALADARALMPVAAKLPGHARRGLRAIGAVQETVSRSLFDTTTLPDGRRLREVRWAELPELAGKYRRLSRVFMAIHHVGTPADPSVTVDQIVNEERLSEIVANVERINDIA